MSRLCVLCVPTKQLHLHSTPVVPGIAVLEVKIVDYLFTDRFALLVASVIPVGLRKVQTNYANNHLVANDLHGRGGERTMKSAHLYSTKVLDSKV